MNLGVSFKNVELTILADRNYRLGPMGKIGNLNLYATGSRPARTPPLRERMTIKFRALLSVAFSSRTHLSYENLRGQCLAARKYLGDVCGKIALAKHDDAHVKSIQKTLNKLAGLDMRVLGTATALQDCVAMHVGRMTTDDCKAVVYGFRHLRRMTTRESILGLAQRAVLAALIKAAQAKAEGRPAAAAPSGQTYPLPAQASAMATVDSPLACPKPSSPDVWKEQDNVADPTGTNSGSDAGLLSNE